jgi:hypothetical protein
MLGCYRRDDFPEPEVFAAHVRRVLSRYPLWVAEQAAYRVPEEFKWVPSVAEIREICEAIYAPYVRAREREARLNAQFAERLAPPARTVQSREEFCQEMKARGLPIRRQDRLEQQFDLAAFKAKFTITDEQLDQVPDRQGSTWKSLKKP